MRFATLASGPVVLSSSGAHSLPVSLETLIASGLPAARAVGAAALETPAAPYDERDLRLPYRPAAVRDFVTFEAHVEGVRKSIENNPGIPPAWYDAPTFYFTNPHALYGPFDAIPRPLSCRELDFELEVGVVVGTGGSSLSVSEAEAAIFGYTIFNDWSARDIQAREMQVGLGPAKGKDFASTIGPWIVTADEFDSLDLLCQVYVNDVLVGEDRLSHMHWTFPEMIAYASRDSRVVPGDLLASGTTGGGGCLAELWGRNGSRTPPPLEPGDVVRMEVEGIGSLTGSVA